MQPHTRALLLEVSGEAPRTHSIRELLGVLVRLLQAHGYRDQVDLVADFVARNRAMLVLAGEAYRLSQYGYLDYSRGMPVS